MLICTIISDTGYHHSIINEGHCGESKTPEFMRHFCMIQQCLAAVDHIPMSSLHCSHFLVSVWALSTVKYAVLFQKWIQNKKFIPLLVCSALILLPTNFSIDVLKFLKIP